MRSGDQGVGRTVGATAARNVWKFRRGPEGERCRGPWRPRHKMRGLATSGPSAGGRAHCALNTAMQPCTQVLPAESL